MVKIASELSREISIVKSKHAHAVLTFARLHVPSSSHLIWQMQPKIPRILFLSLLEQIIEQELRMSHMCIRLPWRHTRMIFWIKHHVKY